MNHISGTMVSMRASSGAVDCRFEPRSGQKMYNGIRCFSTKYTVLRNKSKGWLPRNHVNVS
jgi:hypothetical protein